MKKFVLILSAILLISLLVVSFAQENYEPVSEKERELLKQGYKVVEFNDTFYANLPIILLNLKYDGIRETYKRVVVFRKADSTTSSLDEAHKKWSIKSEKDEKLTLTLYYAKRNIVVTWTQTMTAKKEVKTPISIETKVKVETQVQKKTITTEFGKETK